MEQKTSKMGILIAVTLALFIISFSVILTVAFRPLYYWNLNKLNIGENSGST